MKKQRRCAGARHCRGDLARDDARLARATHDDAAAAPREDLERVDEALVEAMGRGVELLGVEAQLGAGTLEQGVMLGCTLAIGEGN
jgi:hypothetical protein